MSSERCGPRLLSCGSPSGLVVVAASRRVARSAAGIGGRVGLAVFLEDQADVLGDQRGDHAHDVVPVLAEPSKAANRLSCLGRVSASNWFATT